MDFQLQYLLLENDLGHVLLCLIPNFFFRVQHFVGFPKSFGKMSSNVKADFFLALHWINYPGASFFNTHIIYYYFLGRASIIKLMGLDFSTLVGRL
jgi:hypothetical protein